MKQSGNQKRPAPAESIHGAERGRAGGYRAQDVLWEIKSRRGPAEKHFHMADGTDIAVAYERPVHYQAEDGSFREIDSRLSLSQGAERRYKNAAGPMRLSLAEDGGAERLASISHGGYTVALTPQGRGRGKGRLRQKGRAWPQDSFEARVLPRREQSAVDYEEAFPEADLEYLATESLLKENIIVKRPGGSYVYDFLLETDGLSPVSLESGGIELRDGGGKAVFAIPPGYMEDAQGRSSGAVSYELSPRGGDRFLLSVRAEASWMNAAERAFPVTIDPPVSIQGFYNIETGTLHESVPDGVGGQAAMESLGYYAALGKSCRVLVRVNNLPSLPDNSYVVYGGLYLYQLAYADINMPALRIQAQPLLYNSPTEGYWCLYHTWNDCPALGPAADWTDIVNSRQFYS